MLWQQKDEEVRNKRRQARPVPSLKPRPGWPLGHSRAKVWHQQSFGADTQASGDMPLSQGNEHHSWTAVKSPLPWRALDISKGTGDSQNPRSVLMKVCEIWSQGTCVLGWQLGSCSWLLRIESSAFSSLLLRGMSPCTPQAHMAWRSFPGVPVGISPIAAWRAAPSSAKLRT